MDKTRTSLHGVAEMLLAGPQYRASGTIRLQVFEDGFGTVASPGLRVTRDSLLLDGRPVARLEGTFLGVAEIAGIEAGDPEGLYSDGSGLGVDDLITIDPAEADEIFKAFAAGDAALRSLSPETTPVLWPEHFDLAITLDEVNYGVSPGDAHLPQPYAYVGPWNAREGDFWNVSFGAARPLTDLPDISAFFEEGRRLAV